MPIQGRTADKCFNTYKNHIGPLIAATVTDVHQVTLPRLKRSAQARPLYLGNSALKTVPLPSTRYGKIHLQLSQELEAIPQKGGGFQLETQRYWYKILSDDPKYTDEPLFRWEYVKVQAPKDQWCRHHFQIGKVANHEKTQAVTVPLKQGDKSHCLDLNRLHVPTGYVLIEYVIRFLITELGITPPCGDSWPERLAESEAKFFREFSPHAPT